MQAPLFESPISGQWRFAAQAGRLDADSEALLRGYRERRLASGAHPQTVAREVSQLRSLVRGAAMPTGTLRELFSDVRAVARALLEPRTPIAASTGRSRLVAAQRFAQVCGQAIGIPCGSAFVADLASLLPSRTPRDWHSAGLIVAGVKSRRRPLSPTLYPPDLERIVAGVEAPDDNHQLRDRALVAMHCYSGLRPDEIARLRISDIQHGAAGARAAIEMQRTGRFLRLVLPGPSAVALLDLIEIIPNDHIGGAGCIFRRRVSTDKSLTVRAVRAIVQRACARAGFPLASASDLRAAFAYWLRARGLSDHETAAVLGLARVRTLDRLLARHQALDAQRQVRQGQLP